jgi:hypothetical protein
MERATPRAQSRQESEDEYKRKSRRTSSLEGEQTLARHKLSPTNQISDIPEAADKDADDSNRQKSKPASPETAGLVEDGVLSKAIRQIDQAETDISALRTALSECWTLCNTLAGLSSSHRQRTFKFTGRAEVQEQAWRNCWRLCQQLYEKRDEDHASQVIPTMELCRDFCQALFEARQKTDEASDSVLRVSFELNNHLYNTHDRSLPDAFNERTLEFYITLCHRLMKQRTSLPQETDSLLRACWSLAEMLFNLRQSRHEGRADDEELIGSAVQACWDLCDLFREGWSQVRPDRGTPRAGQTSFASSAPFRSGSGQSMRSIARSTSSALSMSKKAYDIGAFPPETPITVFDDTTSTAASSPDSATMPNILVLGPSSTSGGSIRGGISHHDRWSSDASVLSDYSESVASQSVASSQHSSSTATAAAEETHLLRLRCLLLRAAMQIGYARASGQPLQAFVQTLPSTAFGTAPWHIKVFGYYKNLIQSDKSMAAAHMMPSRRLSANEAAKAVRWLGNNDQWAWMRDLFRIVFGFGIDEANDREAQFLV